MNYRTTTTTETTVSFGVSARLVAILGQHLIRDNTVGLMELIKNGYDADATEVTVEMYDLSQPEKTLIVVQDNGVGMTREILTGPWLTVAHGHKEEAKEALRRSRRGRLPLGEKGVGRFAAHKLGRRLVLITRPEGQDTELVLEIDWDQFESVQDSLESIPLKLVERAPRHFIGPDAHGTRLEISRAREKWQRRDVVKLQAALMRLVNPRYGVSDFKVRLRIPEYPELENLDSHDIVDRFQFRLDCHVDADGLFRYTYRWRDAQLQVHEESGISMLWKEGATRPPACGPLKIELSAWMLDQRLLHQLGTNKEQIMALAGISIYRDGFRILPYGDEGDDWLGLDQRRINQPGIRFGNRQLIGAVFIDQVNNRNLVDKTNREGLQENQAFEDLKKIVLAAVNLLEQRSLSERQKTYQSFVEVKKALVDQADRLEKVVRTITTSSEHGGTPKPRPAPEPPRQPEIVAPDGQPHDAVQGVFVEKEQLEELTRTAMAIREQAARVAELQEEERDAYLHLIGSGLAAERFIHEVDRQVARALEAMEQLKQVTLPPEVEPAVRQLDLFVNSLRNELRLLGQLRYVRRSQRARPISVRKITELLLLAYDRQFNAHGIQVDPWLEDDFIVNMSEAALAQVIDNILDNAVYWLSRVNPAGGRRLRIDLDPTERTLVISNNGPAVDRAILDRLFVRPFVTTKPDGHGLGMYLSAEIMKRAGGRIELLPEEETELGGPGFVLRFPPAAEE